MRVKRRLETVDKIEFLGRGGKRTECVKKEDLKQIRDACPNIVVLMIGENDIFRDTDPEGLAGRIVSYATVMCSMGYTVRGGHMQITAMFVRTTLHFAQNERPGRRRKKKTAYLNTWSRIRNRLRRSTKNWERQRKSWTKSLFVLAAQPAGQIRLCHGRTSPRMFSTRVTYIMMRDQIVQRLIKLQVIC